MRRELEMKNMEFLKLVRHRTEQTFRNNEREKHAARRGHCEGGVGKSGVRILLCMCSKKKGM